MPDLSRLDPEEVMEAVEDDDNTGFCTECGEQAFGVEPDAREYDCDSCGAHGTVYGAEELLIMMA